ncbi:MAG TPA: radical SAM protein [bacterium]|nr:radical SAM protein [bacterium]
MTEDTRYILRLDRNFAGFYTKAARISLRSPGLLWQFIRSARWYRKASRIRTRLAEEGVRVPPIIIFSITNRCNLNCTGCYARDLDRKAGDDLSAQELDRIIGEAQDLGVPFFLLAGGEPLVRPEILDITRRYRNITFFLFTNGMLIDDAMTRIFRKQKNIVPVVSLEGHESETDGRRGSGMFSRLKEAVGRLRKHRIFFALSMTATRRNISVISADAFVLEMMEQGCKMFLYVEYTPIREETRDWIPTDTQREDLDRRVKGFRERYPAMFVSLPGDEDQFGGCISSGRGFVHISADGRLEPCPFAPFSDVSLKEMPLKDALKSRLLAVIRENVDQLEEGPGGCSLWQKREWVESLLGAQSESGPGLLEKERSS